MIARALRASAFPIVLAAILNLLPPGWGSKPHRVDPSKLQVPSALANGSRAAGFRSDVAFPMRAVVTPAPARLGQSLTYRAHVIVGDRARAVFSSPDTGGAFTWGAARMGRVPLEHMPENLHGSIYNADSVWLEIPLQVFATGSVSIPGPAVKIVPANGVSAPIRSRFPTLHLIVLPTITAADSNATLRAVHGPLGAPWWERVPWRIVTAVAFLVAVLVTLVVGWRRRRRPLAAGVAQARDAGARSGRGGALCAGATARPPAARTGPLRRARPGTHADPAALPRGDAGHAAARRHEPGTGRAIAHLPADRRRPANGSRACSACGTG